MSDTVSTTPNHHHAFWVAHHYQPLPGWKHLLAPLSWGYSLGVEVRNALFNLGWQKTVDPGVPVISIGNLSAGGTGKTPVTLVLARYLISKGLTVVILSRGYGATAPLDYGQPTAPEHGDEPWLLQQLLPDATVIVGRDRATNSEKAVVQYRPDVILLDDGFQYRRLKRTVDVVLVDGEKGLGNQWVLPLGPLREPVFHLNRASIIGITKDADPELCESLSRRFMDTPVTPLPFAPSGIQHWFSRDFLPVNELAGRSVLVFSGIAQPDQFERDLIQVGFQIQHHLAYPDHHPYTAADIDTIMGRWDGKSLIITTDKDRVKVIHQIPDQLRPYVYSFLVEPVLNETFLSAVLTQAGLTGKGNRTESRPSQRATATLG